MIADVMRPVLRLVAFAALGAAATTAPALAQQCSPAPGPGLAEVTVHDGPAYARHRIGLAAREVCQHVRDLHPRDGQVSGGCMAMAVRGVLHQAQGEAGYPIGVIANRQKARRPYNSSNGRITFRR